MKSGSTLRQQEVCAAIVPFGALGCVGQVTAVLLQQSFMSFPAGQAQQ